MQQCPLHLGGGIFLHFPVYFLCTLIAKKRKNGAINANRKKPENPHKQRKNPHFCGFSFGGEGEIRTIIKLLKLQHFLCIYETSTDIYHTFSETPIASYRRRFCFVVAFGTALSMASFFFRLAELVMVLPFSSLSPVIPRVAKYAA